MTTIQTPITVGCWVAHHFQCQCIIWIHVEHIVMEFKFERRFCQICNLSPWLQATKVVQMHINLAIPPGNAWLKHWWDSGSCGTSSGTLYTKNLHKQQTCRSHLRSLFLTPVHHEFASWHTCTQSHSFVMYFSNVEASSSKELWFFMWALISVWFRTLTTSKALQWNRLTSCRWCCRCWGWSTCLQWPTAGDRMLGISWNTEKWWKMMRRVLHYTEVISSQYWKKDHSYDVKSNIFKGRHHRPISMFSSARLYC